MSSDPPSFDQSRGRPDFARPKGFAPLSALSPIDGLPADLAESLDDIAGTTETGSAEPAASYWELSRTPLTSLVFTLPLVAAYEGGVLVLGRGSPRNGADVWLRDILESLGFGQYFLLPLATVAGLLAWQFLAHDRWKLSLSVLPGMVAECLLWAVVLVGVGRVQQGFFPLGIGPPELPALAVDPFGGGFRGVFARIVSFCGAGLYEEVLFRLLLLPAGVWLLRRLGCGPLAAGGWAVLASSLLFSAAHYVGPLGDTFQLESFVFRTLAGMLFAALFLVRGFGIAAGSHFFYDLLVGLV
jgi:hypothetical protein